MKQIDFIKEYFYAETEGFHIKDVKLAERKDSYLFSIKCYYITTHEDYDFYVFYSDTIPTNIYPIRNGEILDECYYKYIGLMTELCSRSISNNFIVQFVNRNSIFPILERKMKDIDKEITPSKNATQLKGIANQIRDCYLYLTDYLMNKCRTENPEFKNDNFKDNYQEFLQKIMPGKQSETRRNSIIGIAQKGWKLNAELVHKDSVTLFDICISFNILQLIVSTTSNLMVGDNMPFNKIKCPNCQSENFSMRQDSARKEYVYACKDCKTIYSLEMKEMLRDNSTE